MLGTFEERKGHRYLMNAMTKVFEMNSNLHLLLLGSGTKEETLNLELLISQYRWSQRVHLTGFVEDISQYMSIADILVIPSQENESFGLTAIEAMSYGIPIVSTNIGGLPETIGENGGCGFYTSIDDINGFSDNIINLINDESLAKKMSQNGLNRANEIYAPSRMAKQYMSLLSPDKKI